MHSARKQPKYGYNISIRISVLFARWHSTGVKMLSDNRKTGSSFVSQQSMADAVLHYENSMHPRSSGH